MVDSISGPAVLLPGSDHTWLVQFCAWTSATNTDVSATMTSAKKKKKTSLSISGHNSLFIAVVLSSNFEVKNPCYGFCSFSKEVYLNSLCPIIVHSLITGPWKLKCCSKSSCRLNRQQSRSWSREVRDFDSFCFAYSHGKRFAQTWRHFGSIISRHLAGPV